MSANTMDLGSALKILSIIAEGAQQISLELKGKYGIIHKQAFINYMGVEGRLVWDYILLNELTFEERATGKQYSLGVSPSDKKTEEMFNDLVDRYGI